MTLVREFDIDSMAKSVVKILKMEEDEYYSIVVNDEVEEFVRKHSSWKATVNSLCNDLWFISTSSLALNYFS